MSTAWLPTFVLPNISLQTPIGCDLAALAPAHDPRIDALKRAHPNFKRFLGRFSDAFGERFEPTTLILKMDAPPIFRDVATLASFRDLIAISTISRARAHGLRSRVHRGVMFGDAFAIYPWMLDKHYEDMIGSTPAIFGTHDLSKFKGQSSPSLPRTTLDQHDIDQPLLAALMARWQVRYEAANPAWVDVALMRSLNMSYSASLLPAGTETTIYDVGRIVSLWVSAFEILTHPGGDGKTNRDKVFKLIEGNKWLIEASRETAHATGNKNNDITATKRILASWLYQELNKCRNDFLHGNPVDRDHLTLPISRKPLFAYAAPLYRMALTAFLPLTFCKLVPPLDKSAACGAYIAERLNFYSPQREAEQALLTARQPPPTPPSPPTKP